jgi:hypothetical protein
MRPCLGLADGTPPRCSSFRKPRTDAVCLSPHSNHKAACVEESVVPYIACSIVVEAAIKSVQRLGQVFMKGLNFILIEWHQCSNERLNGVVVVSFAALQGDAIYGFNELPEIIKCHEVRASRWWYLTNRTLPSQQDRSQSCHVSSIYEVGPP